MSNEHAPQKVATRSVEIFSPFPGLLIDLEAVPDPVFAQKMVGDGFSVDPLADTMVAPIAGEIIDIQPSHHALTIRHEQGLEVLIHIGLDTVSLEGEGFEMLAKDGQQVDVGTPLIRVDLDLVGTKAKSLLTQVVVANMEMVEKLTARTGRVDAKDPAATVILARPSDNGPGLGGKTLTSPALIIPNPTGLHARPAATLVALAKEYTADIRLRRGNEMANAKSIVSVMKLGLARGEKVTLSAHGPDAQEALDKLSQAIREGLGEEVTPVAPSEVVDAHVVGETDAVTAEAPTASSAAPATPVFRSGNPDVLLGVAASPGLGIGTVVQMGREDVKVERDAADKHAERRVLDDALDRARLDVGTLKDKLAESGSADKAAIFAAHEEILNDPEVLDMAFNLVARGRSAAFAWKSAYQSLAEQLAGLDNEVLAGRAADVRDVGMRVLDILTGQEREGTQLPDNAVLIAEELTPSDTAQIDPTQVVALVTTTGGASSHVAIISRSLGLPLVAGAEAHVLDIPAGQTVVVDGDKGQVLRNLDEAALGQIRSRQERINQARAAFAAHKHESATTTDGHQVAVVANIGGVADAKQVADSGAEGVGLLRSEFVFMEAASAPDEQTQTQIYTQCAQALAPGQPLVIRTLDVGGDKPLSYLPIAREENPFLGMRGIRVGLDHPEILQTQIRALINTAQQLVRSGSEVKLHVMFPMIATVSDWRRAKAVFDAEAQRALEADADASWRERISLGIMMEVPSVGIMARQFAAEEGCDFFSVGTNDLTSYTLAMDRGHPKLAEQVDPCTPAALALIGQAAQALHEKGKWIGVCGAVASDAQAVPILVGLGVDELSCSLPAVAEVKAAVRAYSFAHCQELAQKALTAATPAEVRALVPSIYGQED